MGTLKINMSWFKKILLKLDIKMFLLSWSKVRCIYKNIDLYIIYVDFGARSRYLEQG